MDAQWHAKQKIDDLSALSTDQRAQANQHIDQLVKDDSASELTPELQFSLQKVVAYTSFINKADQNLKALEKMSIPAVQKQPIINKIHGYISDTRNRLIGVMNVKALQAILVSSENLLKGSMDQLTSVVRIQLLQEIRKHYLKLKATHGVGKFELVQLKKNFSDLQTQMMIDDDINGLFADYHQGMQDLDQVLHQRNFASQILQSLDDFITKLEQLIKKQTNYPASYRQYDYYVLEQHRDELPDLMKHQTPETLQIWQQDVETELRQFVLTEFVQFYLGRLKKIKADLGRYSYETLTNETGLIQADFEQHQYTLATALKLLKDQVWEQITSFLKVNERTILVKRLKSRVSQAEYRLGSLAQNDTWKTFQKTVKNSCQQILNLPDEQAQHVMKNMLSVLNTVEQEIVYNDSVKQINQKIAELNRKLKDSRDLDHSEVVETASQMEYAYHQTMHQVVPHQDVGILKTAVKKGLQELETIYSHAENSNRGKHVAREEILSKIKEDKAQIQAFRNIQASQKEYSCNLLDKIVSGLDFKEFRTRDEVHEYKVKQLKVAKKIFDQVITANELIASIQAANAHVRHSKLSPNEKQQVIDQINEIMTLGVKAHNRLTYHAKDSTNSSNH